MKEACRVCLEVTTASFLQSKSHTKSNERVAKKIKTPRFNAGVFA